jgi:NitT/TauT family transport system substrate-binding protein
MPLYLNTRNPNVKSIKDFTDKDKIALPAVKVSIQAVTLQMAAAKEFGEKSYGALDRLTVSMKHPDGMAALLSPASEITAHFTSPPFQYQELEHPGVHTVLNSFDVLGGPATFNVVWTTEKFRKENPKIYTAFLKAFREAVDEINKDKAAAAQNYITWAKYKGPKDLPLKVLNDPQLKFTLTPQNTIKYADFMYQVGSIKVKPQSWKDLFFPEVHDLPGS